MKKQMRITALFLMLVLCLSCFAACKKNPAEGDGLEGETSGDSETAAPFDRNSLLILAENKASEYVIVRDNEVDQEARNAINAFSNSFRAKTGVRLTINEDNQPTVDKEILIYDMDDRRMVSQELRQIMAPDGNGYRIVAKENKIIVACDQVCYLEAALELLLNAITEYPEAGEGVYGIPNNYVGTLDIPLPATSLANIKSVYTAEGNYTLNVANSAESDYNAYCARLMELGFTQYSTNTIGENKFATYIKNDTTAAEAVYTMFYPSEDAYKVTYGALKYLPTQTAQPVGSNVVTPSITQIGRKGLDTAPGMSLIVQCADGSYLIFDGGNSNTSDKADLLKFLEDNNPNEGRPVIAGWFITHAHGDHINLVNDFLDSYASSIDLRMVAYNLPDWDNLGLTWEESQGSSAAGLKANAVKFKNIIKAKYPSTETWVVHTGENWELPGVSLEVLYTPEDHATTTGNLGGLQSDGSLQFGSGNHTCTAYRLMVNKTSFMVLGDSESTLCQWMYETYGSAMKSDILQLTHHGSNGGYLKYYQAIDPSVCIWPCSAEQKASNQNKYNFNQYLCNLGSYSSGRTRVHHTAEQTVTYLCTDDGYVLKS